MVLSKNKNESVNIEFLINNKIDNNNIGQILFIVPTNRKVRALTKNILDNSKNNSLTNFRIHTLSTLSFLLFEELYSNQYFILDDATAVIQLKKIISESELKYFPNDEDLTTGIILEIKNVISEFKKTGITPSVLRNDLELLSGGEKAKAEDLINIYERYLSECNKKKLFELGDIYHFIVQADKSKFSSAVKTLFPEKHTLIIEGFDEFTNPEIKIINSIASLFENSYIIFDFYEGNNDLFYHLLKSFNNLKNFGFTEIKQEIKYSNKSFKTQLKQNLFSYNPIKQNTDIKISLNPCQNRYDEVIFISKLIKKLLSERIYSTNEICVVFNQISTYSKIINEVFEDFGVPCNLTDRFLLSDSPPVISLINFLEILENKFYYKNIFRALSGRWIEIPDLDKINLLNVSVNLKIVSGYENWIRKIDNILVQFENNSDTDFNYLPKESYLKAKQDILIIKKYLEPFDILLSPREFFKQTSNLINQLDLISKCVNDYELYTEKNTRALTEFVEMLNNITKIIEIEYGNKKHNLSFYLESLKAAAQFTRYNNRENSGVLITTIDEIRGLNFKVVIVGGLVDGEFPSKYKPEILIPNKYKILEEGHLAKERYKFYQALSVADNEIILTYPENDEEVELPTSSFINDLKSIFNICILNREELDLMLCSTYEIKKNIRVNSLSSVEKDLLADLKISLDSIDEKCKIDFERRINPYKEFEFNAYMNFETDSIIKTELEKHSIQQHFSASRLEDYAKCPFMFLLKRIFNIKPFKEPIEEVEAFELGTIVHSILYDFYLKVKEKNVKIENCSDDQFEELLDLIFSIANEKINKENFSNTFSFFELEKILGINGNRKYSLLYRFLEEERKYQNGFIPFMFEKKFGKYSNENQVEVNGISLQGSIDRVDINHEQKLFSVIDYKLRGKNITREDINERIALQLPLYLYAAKKLIETELNEVYQPYSAEIYSLKLTKDDFGRKIKHNSNSRKLDTKDLIEINNQMIEMFIETINDSVEKIRKGEFYLSKLKKREDKVCNYCDFITVCRVKEII